MVNREGREAIISVRLSAGEEEQIKAAAERRGEPVSAFVREAALRVAERAPGHWSTSPGTIASTGTVIPDVSGLVSISSPAPATAPGTAGTAPEPITRSR